MANENSTGNPPEPRSAGDRTSPAAPDGSPGGEARLAWLASFPDWNPNPIVEADESGNIRYLNPAAARTFPDLRQLGREHPWFAGWAEATRAARGRATLLRAVTIGDATFQQSIHHLPETGCFRVYGMDITERERAVRALADAEQRWRRILDNMREGCAILDHDWNYLYVNQVNASHAHLRPEEMRGRNLLELLPGVEKSVFFEAYRRCMQERTPQRAEARFDFPDGTWAWYEAIAEPVPEGIFVLSMDITERKRAELTVQESERLYRAIGESIDFGVWVCAPDGRNTYASPSFLHLVGMTQQQCSDFGWGDVLHPDDAGRTLAAWKECVRTGGTWDIEHRYRGADGKWHPVLARGVPVRNERGEVICWAGINLDISRLKQTEAALQDTLEGMVRAEKGLREALAVAEEGRRTLKALMEHVPEGITIADADGVTIRMVSRHGQELLGGPHAGVTARDVAGRWTVFHEDGVTPMEADDLPLARAIQRGETLHNVELVQANDRGEHLTLLCNAAPIRDASGAILGGIVAWHDITELKKMRDALRASAAELREMDRRKDEFLAVLSHELRNPLTPIRNGLLVLGRADPGSMQAQRARVVIERQVGQLSRLVDDLLDVTRISRGKIRVNRCLLDLTELLRHIGEDFRTEFLAAGVTFEAHVPERPVCVVGDAARLSQAVGNLLHNAAKFTDSGGHVTLTLEEDAPSGSAVVRVHDTGVGIAPEVLARLFNPFTQAESTLDRNPGGLGLGLALVKGLAELHDGSVDVRSAGLGHGAEFSLRLPLVPHHVAAPSGPSPPAAAPSRRILVIEDNLDAAESQQMALELDGHEVEVARDGPEGLEQARVFHPEFVLCDIGLPGMSGYDVARAFRADSALNRVRLIALTGYALPEDVDRTREAGFDEHLAKPPDPVRLRHILARG